MLVELKERILANAKKRNLKHSGNEKKILRAQITYYIEIIRIKASSLLNDIFVMANASLIMYLERQVVEGDILLIGSGSNRVDVMKNILGMARHGTHSIYSDLLYFAKYFRKRLSDKNITVGLNPYTLTDIDADLPIGENYRLIFNEDPESNYPSCVYDHSKLALILGYVFNLSERFPDQEIIVHCFEDMEHIREAIVGVLTKHNDLLPLGAKLFVHHYDGVVRSTIEIVGSGPHDSDYRHNIRYLVMLAQDADNGLGSSSINIEQFVDFREFLAYRAIRAGQKYLVCEIDAPTIYNKTFTRLLAYVARNFGDEISALFSKMQINNEDITPHCWVLYNKLVDAIRLLPIDSLKDDYCDDLPLFKRNIIYKHASILNVINPKIVAYMLNVANFELYQRWILQAEAAQCQTILLTMGDEGAYGDSFAADLSAFTQQLNLADDPVSFVLDRRFNGEALVIDSKIKNHAEQGHEPVCVMEKDQSVNHEVFNEMIRLKSPVMTRRNHLFSDEAAQHVARTSLTNPGMALTKY